MLGSTWQVCTFMFLGEMILKLIAFKFRGYIKSRWNIFDGVVVVISLIDTVLTLSNLIDNTGTSVLRSFRLVSILIEVLKNGLKYFSFCLYWSQLPQVRLVHANSDLVIPGLAGILFSVL